MQLFTTLRAKTAKLLIDNIDTDMIIPKQFLKTITRKGLGSKLFYEMRFPNDKIDENFELNKKPDSKILLSGDNFGCGSSREHAPWAILDFGISCVIAQSFADIFYNNCFENGILPIVLKKHEIEALLQYEELFIDLANQKVASLDEAVSFTFEIDAFKKHCLLNAIDSIGMTLEKTKEIKEFEKMQKQQNSWL